jgi:hypothetical protein
MTCPLWIILIIWYLQLYGRRWRQTVLLKKFSNKYKTVQSHLGCGKVLQAKQFQEFEKTVVSSSSKVRHLTLEDKGTMILQTVKNYSPSDSVTIQKTWILKNFSKWGNSKVKSESWLSEHQLEILSTPCYSMVGTKQMITV